MNVDKQTALGAIRRLISTASRDTGQSRRVANFLLLAWHNAEENGGWDPVDLGPSMRTSQMTCLGCCSSSASTIVTRPNWASRKRSK
jgi:hypothetical protein